MVVHCPQHDYSEFGGRFMHYENHYLLYQLVEFCSILLLSYQSYRLMVTY